MQSWHRIINISDESRLQGVVALCAKRGHALLRGAILSWAYMLQTQDDKEKRDMTDNYCGPKIPFTLKFDSPRAGMHNFMQICTCTWYMYAYTFLKKISIFRKVTRLGDRKQGFFWLGLVTRKVNAHVRTFTFTCTVARVRSISECGAGIRVWPMKCMQTHTLTFYR